MVTHISSNLDSNFDYRLRLNDSSQTNDVGSDIKGLIDLLKRFPYNPLIRYININFPKKKSDTLK